MSQADTGGGEAVSARVVSHGLPSPALRSQTTPIRASTHPATPAPATLPQPDDLYAAWDSDDEDVESRLAAPRGGAAAISALQAPSREMLWVQVVSAVGIPSADSSGKSDAFCVLTVEPVPEAVKGALPPLRQRLETRHCPKTLEPVWCESFSFSLQQVRYEGGAVARPHCSCLDLTISYLARV